MSNQNDENKKTEVTEEEKKQIDDFAASLLNPYQDENPLNDDDDETSDDDELSEEEKQKNAEEAKKRREREAKQKAEEEAKKKAEEEAKKKAEEEAQKKAAEEKAKKEAAENKNIATLAKQIADFQLKYPDVDMSVVQKDEDFTEYMRGKLLGKKTFTEIFEDYANFVSRVTGRTIEDVIKSKNKPSSGSSKASGSFGDVFSIEELNKKAEKYNSLSPEEKEKYIRSVRYHDKR